MSGGAGSPTAGSGVGASGGSGGGNPSEDVPSGAVSFFFPATQGCALAEQWLDFPPVAGGHPVTATEKVANIEDGAADEEGFGISRLTCYWRSTFAGVGFTFGRAGNQGIVSITPDKVLTPHEKGLVVTGPDWEDVSYGGLCVFTNFEVDETTRSIWGSVTCSTLGIVGEDTEPCVLADGYYWFENCVVE